MLALALALLLVMPLLLAETHSDGSSWKLYSIAKGPWQVVMGTVLHPCGKHNVAPPQPISGLALTFGEMRDGAAPQRRVAGGSAGFAGGDPQVKAARHARREIAGARARHVEQSGRSCRAA